MPLCLQCPLSQSLFFVFRSRLWCVYYASPIEYVWAHRFCPETQFYFLDGKLFAFGWGSRGRKVCLQTVLLPHYIVQSDLLYRGRVLINKIDLCDCELDRSYVSEKKTLLNQTLTIGIWIMSVFTLMIS